MTRIEFENKEKMHHSNLISDSGVDLKSFS